MMNPRICKLEISEGPDGLLDKIDFTIKAQPAPEYGGIGIEFSSLVEMDGFIAALQRWRDRLGVAFPGHPQAPASYAENMDPLLVVGATSAEEAVAAALEPQVTDPDDDYPF